MAPARVTTEVATIVHVRDGGCIAPRVGGSSNDCWGRDRLEHVKSEARMGVRAESDPMHLVVLCQGHTEDGMKGGYVWCTDADNRAACRRHLATFYPCGCSCKCHWWQHDRRWPGPCAVCCEPGDDCECGRALSAAGYTT